MVRRIPEGVKRPQMQWNILSERRPNPLMAGMSDPAWVYFVHSYAPEMTGDVVATCDYGGPVVAAAQRGAVSRIVVRLGSERMAFSVNGRDASSARVGSTS